MDNWSGSNMGRDNVRRWCGESISRWVLIEIRVHVHACSKSSKWGSVHFINYGWCNSVAQEITGEDLLELGKVATVEQLRECGLATVGQQMRLRRLLSKMDSCSSQTPTASTGTACTSQASVASPSADNAVTASDMDVTGGFCAFPARWCHLDKVKCRLRITYINRVLPKAW